MNAEELATKLDKMASGADADAQPTYGGQTRYQRQFRHECLARRDAFVDVAALIRAHLCTQNPLHDAAPDMLAALEKIADVFHFVPHEVLARDPPSDLSAIIIAVRRAIAKAKGPDRAKEPPMSDPIAEAYKKGRADLLAELQDHRLNWFHPANDGSEYACLECAESILEYGDHSTVYEVLERAVVKHHFFVRMSELNDGYWENRSFNTNEEAEAWIAQRQLELDGEMTDPATCIPPDPSVSGWWWLTDDCFDPRPRGWQASSDYDFGGFWAYYPTDPCSATQVAEEGYRILGPVPSHAEVEAFRVELTAANAQNVTLGNICQSWREQSDTWEHQATKWAMELMADKDKLARLREGIANPDSDAKAIYDAAYARGLRDAHRWLPIADAPRDGRTIIVEGGTAHWNGKAWYSDQAQDEIQWQVTIWQPLPPAPEPKS